MSLLAVPEVVAPVAAPVAPVAAAPVAAAPVAGNDLTDLGAGTPVAPVAAAPVAAAPVAPVRPEGVPDALWDATTGLKTTEALARLGELETADAARRADVPADAAGYKLELATPINDPVTGNPIAFNAEDPLAKSALAWAHENGVSQPVLSKLLGVFAENEMATLAANNAAVAAETAKLGPTADARFAAVSAGLAKHAGVDGAKAIMATLGSADAVIALETLIKKFSGPSVGTPPVGDPKSALAGLSGEALLAATLS